MKNLFIFFSFVFVAGQAFAGDLACVVQELENGESQAHELVVPESNDPHGSMQYFKMQKYTDYSGFVAIVKGITVIHLYHKASGQAFTSHSESGGTRYARLQVLLPGPGSSAIVVDCSAK